MLSILFHNQPGLVLRSVCRVTCIMAHTAAFPPDGAMPCALLLPGPVRNDVTDHPSIHVPGLLTGLLLVDCHDKL
jgi:hypothetical protein